ncbi:MAG: c-type cytochrome [Proteobacteria bacterium]|nr:c-type cytochrome [Pseudomonadota bacterium]
MKPSHKIKAKPGIRALFVVFTLMLGITLFLVGAGENEKQNQWQNYQITYKALSQSRLTEKRHDAEQAGNADAVDQYTRMLTDMSESPEKMQVVFLPGSQSRDLCMTCHMAMENPLFSADAHPLKNHPKEILLNHPISNYGCTLCHHGQGVGLTVEKAHGFEENWESPRLPLAYTQATCFECHDNVYGLKGAEKGAAGKALFVEKGCYGCHDARVRPDLPKFSTPFNGIPQKIAEKAWLREWIIDPKKIRPATLMPTFRLTDAQRIDLVSYLFTMNDSELKDHLSKNTMGAAQKGKEVFIQKACVACHSEKADSPGQSRRVPLLSDAGLKLKDDWLITWITDPLSVNPDTWMPKLDLTDDDARNLAAYLKTLGSDPLKTSLAVTVPDGDNGAGKSLAQSLGCMGCHSIKGSVEPAKVGVSVSDVADKRMEELPFGESDVPHTKWDWLSNKITKPEIYKTKDMPMAMPNFDLTTQDVEHLTVFYLFNRLKNLPETYLVREANEEAMEEKGEWMLAHFNCRGCHTVVSGEIPRIDTFLAKKSLVPPRIVDETEKVQPVWLYNYLNRPFPMRPWLSIRMPTFNISYDDKTLMIDYMHSLMPGDKKTKVAIPFETALVKTDYDKETLDMGEYRFRSDKCMQCHPVSFSGELPEGKKLEDLSIDLMLAKSRLRFDWIRNFLRNPDQYAGAGTKMPFVFYTPDKAARIPDPEDWIMRTSLFMMFMDKVPEPLKAEDTTRKVEVFDFDSY